MQSKLEEKLHELRIHHGFDETQLELIGDAMVDYGLSCVMDPQNLFEEIKVRLNSD